MQNSHAILSRADFKRVIDACEKLHLTEPGKSFIEQSSVTLNAAFSDISFSAALYRLQPFRVTDQRINTPNYGCWMPKFKRHILARPLRQHCFAIVDVDKGMIPLELQLKEFHYSSLYTELCDLLETSCQFWLGIRDGNELLNCVFAHEKEWSEDQLAMVCLTQSDLESAWIDWKRVAPREKGMNLLKSTRCLTDEEKISGAQIRKALDALTDRQREVIIQVALGKDNQQIADELDISIQTVKTHLKTVFRLLNVQHRTELAARWHTAHTI